MFIFEENQWKHKTKLKCTINPILRKIQFFTDKPWVIASLVEFKNKKPVFLGYRLRKLKAL